MDTKKDHFVLFQSEDNGSKINTIVYMPFEENSPLPMAVARVFSLFALDEKEVKHGEEAKTVYEESEGAKKLVLCPEGMLHKMIKFHNSYIPTFNEFSVKLLIDPTESKKTFTEYAKDVYETIMGNLSHQYSK